MLSHATLCSNKGRCSGTIHFRNLGLTPQIGPGLGEHNERGRPDAEATSDTGIAPKAVAAATVPLNHRAACVF